METAYAQNAALYVPSHFTGKRIKFRVPYGMPGELAILANQSGVLFPDATFLHNVELPFEIWRVYVRLTGIDADGEILEGPFLTIGKRIRLRVDDTSKNQRLTKAPTLVDTFINSLAGSTGAWEWHIPYTLVNAEGFSVQVDSLAYTNMVNVNTVRVEMNFQGYLLVLEPPSETR